MSKLYDWTTAVARGFYRIWLETPPVLDASIYFPMAARFEEHYPEIRREVLSLPGGLAGMPKVHEVLGEQTDLFESDSIPWRFMPLHAFGRPHLANQRLCPVTSRLVGEVPGLLNATFSVLEPGKHLTAHKGPYAGMMRFHLGVVVPPPAEGKPPSALRVEDRFLIWREGKGFLFDDSFTHEAWNNADRPRIVLIVDFSNPTMPAPLRAFDRLLRGFVCRLPFVERYMRQGTIEPRPGPAGAASAA